LETGLRQELYQWNHFRCDMIVEPVVYSSLVGGPTGSYADYGIQEQLNRADDGLNVGYIPVIDNEADADRIVTPRVWYDRAATEENYQSLCEIFDGIIPVKKRGIVHQWHSPWDQMIHWYGIERLFIDMYDRPGLVHRVLGNFTRALNEALDRQEKEGMLDVGNGIWTVGSGGYGITDELPRENHAGHRVTAKEQWGCSTAQIFSGVSPEMHEEFALQYERKVLSRFGLTYYGCCEPLHKKVGILRSIKNLRKISMSPWINLAEASETISGDYVFSFKPNPAHLAAVTFDPELVRNYLKTVRAATRQNRCEWILKDITTVCNDPRRLDQWAAIAVAEALDIA
ncbi:MAG: hypothetical protein KJ964_06195, partial [Verrucomicrobia bacterium]|nr:hypothetical protein [Verrucomicrobiota bacterium]